MHLDPILPTVVGVSFVVLLIGLFLRRFHQPHVVAYLLAGVAVGPHGLGLLQDQAGAARLGEFGVVLLLFFVGMEVSLPRLAANWRVAIIGTLLQILLTVGVVYGLGWWLGWPLGRSILLGFVVTLSSTAVVVALLADRGQLNSEIGHDAVGVLLVQDLALVPMLLVIGLLSPGEGQATGAGLQILGGVVVFALIAWILRHGYIPLPFADRLREDHELQVISAFLICFGFATLTALAHLSTALGAFIAGLVVASARETEWVHESLHSLRVLLVALFFVSVGLLIDVRFVIAEWLVVVGLVALIMVANTGLNAAILRGLGRGWRRSLFVGAMLAQVGEFSFVMAAVGHQNGLVSDYAYQLTMALIALTLLISPAWVAAAGRLTGISLKEGGHEGGGGGGANGGHGA